VNLLRTHADHQPGEELRLLARLQRGQRLARKARHLGLQLVERVTGKVEAEGDLFLVEALPFAPPRHFDVTRAMRSAVRVVTAVEDVEQAHLHGVALGLLGGFDGNADRRQQARTMVVERVEGTGTNQRLDGAPVDHALVRAATEVEEILERPPAARASRIVFTACSPVPLTAPSP